jgi:hypothetical protein
VLYHHIEHREGIAGTVTRCWMTTWRAHGGCQSAASSELESRWDYELSGVLLVCVAALRELLLRVADGETQGVDSTAIVLQGKALA